MKDTKPQPFLLDAHEDIAHHIIKHKRDFVNPRIDAMITLPELKRGGVSMVFASLFNAKLEKEPPPREMARRQMGVYRRLFAEHADSIVQVKSKRDALALAAEHAEKGASARIGVMLTMEGADAIAGDRDLERFYAAGVRAILPTWGDNRYGFGRTNMKDPITDAGRWLIRRMDQMRILLDVSHFGVASFMSALDAANRPVIASHSNCYAVCKHPRNLNDMQIRALADKRGVMGVCLYNQFIKDGAQMATLDDVWAHVSHVLDIVGDDHLGVGTDFDGGVTKEYTPIGLDSIGDLPLLVNFLREKGLSDEAVAKIAGGNMLRVLASVIA
jgi:membrane dipeptidase